MLTCSALLLSLLLSGAPASVVYDSGEPMLEDGDIPFMSVWRVLDPLDDLCVRVVVPFELTAPTRVTALAFYSFNPKDPADKLVDIYAGTDENSVGTPLQQLTFENHEGVRQGWNVFTLAQPIQLTPGKYGVAFHGRYEFHGYWAANAPNGPGWAWVRINDDRAWLRCGEEDFGVLPNFGLRVYGAYGPPTTVKSARPGGAMEPGPGPKPRMPGPQPALEEPFDTSVPGTPDNYEYEPGTAEEAFHVIWRPARSERTAAEELE
jgi:hypothetical protein